MLGSGCMFVLNLVFSFQIITVLSRFKYRLNSKSFLSTSVLVFKVGISKLMQVSQTLFVQLSFSRGGHLGVTSCLHSYGLGTPHCGLVMFCSSSLRTLSVARPDFRGTTNYLQSICSWVKKLHGTEMTKKNLI